MESLEQILVLVSFISFVGVLLRAFIKGVYFRKYNRNEEFSKTSTLADYLSYVFAYYYVFEYEKTIGVVEMFWHTVGFVVIPVFVLSLLGTLLSIFFGRD